MEIKSVTQKTTIKETGRTFTTAYTEYDAKGNEILSIDYDDNGEVLSKNVTKYNEQGRRTELTIFSDEETVNETHFYEYTPEGRAAKETIEYEGGFKSVKTYQYTDGGLTLITVDEDGNTEETEKFATDKDGNVTEHTVIDYNGEQTLHQMSEFADGKLIITKNLDRDGREIDHRIYKYDEAGRMSFLGILNPKKELLDSHAYQYDDRGREILQTIGSRGKITTEYNDELRTVTVITSTGTGNIVNQTVSTYNEDGKIVKEEDFNTVREYEYSYFPMPE